MANPASIVFAHGLWADGSCFNKLIPTLQAEGHEVFASQHGLDSLESDVACVNFTHQPRPRPGRARRPLLRRDPDHQGGHPRPRRRPGVHRRTRPGRGRDVAGTAGQVRPARPSSTTSTSPTGACGSSPRVSRTSAATSRRPSRSSSWPRVPCRMRTCSTSRFPVPPGATKPSWSIVATNDRTVNPELERFAAKRMGAKTYEVASSHVPMLSHPDLVLDVIREAAKSLERTKENPNKPPNCSRVRPRRGRPEIRLGGHVKFGRREVVLDDARAFAQGDRSSALVGEADQLPQAFRRRAGWSLGSPCR